VLAGKWTQKEVDRFVRRVNEVLEVLPENPQLFRRSHRIKSLHIGLIVKQVSLVYRVRDDLGEIELITFVNNYRKPTF
jgi:plasmid stabilization system protein ParE